jgi:co-chaperonin GroES (HSP10)
MQPQNTFNGRLEPLHDGILVTDIEQGERKTHAGVIVVDDDGKDHGIRPRWARVYDVGSEIDWLQKGQWVLIEHGRWSRAVKDGSGQEVRRAENESCLAVADENPLQS